LGRYALNTGGGKGRRPNKVREWISSPKHKFEISRRWKHSTRNRVTSQKGKAHRKKGGGLNLGGKAIAFHKKKDLFR